MLNPVDIIKVGLIAFVGVWVINHGLTAMGVPQYKA